MQGSSTRWASTERIGNMPLEALLGVEDTTGVDVAIDALEALEARLDGDLPSRDCFARLVQRIVPLVLEQARVPRQRWRRCFQLVVANQAEQVHALRPALVSATE